MSLSPPPPAVTPEKPRRSAARQWTIATIACVAMTMLCLLGFVIARHQAGQLSADETSNGAVPTAETLGIVVGFLGAILFSLASLICGLIAAAMALRRH